MLTFIYDECRWSQQFNKCSELLVWPLWSTQVTVAGSKCSYFTSNMACSTNSIPKDLFGGNTGTLNVTQLESWNNYKKFQIFYSNSNWRVYWIFWQVLSRRAARVRVQPACLPLSICPCFPVLSSVCLSNKSWKRPEKNPLFLATLWWGFSSGTEEKIRHSFVDTLIDSEIEQVTRKQNQTTKDGDHSCRKNKVP